MKRILIIFFLLSCAFSAFAQTPESKKDHVKRYSQAQVLDSTEGMLIYDKMMKVLQMDYELLYKESPVVQGWNEEYYGSGQLMHISFYRDGKLILFKNFLENGQCENHITYTDPENCNIDVYFEAGGLKNQLHFNDGLPVKLTEFFSNGLPKSQIEFDKENKCLNSKRTWFLNAEMQSEIVLIDPVKKKYSERTYYPNGQIREEGELIYIPETKEYIKTGTWLTFENSGRKKSTEKFRVSLSSR